MDEETARYKLVKAAMAGVFDASQSSADNAVAIKEIKLLDDHSFSVILPSGTEIHFSTIAF